MWPRMVIPIQSPMSSHHQQQQQRAGAGYGAQQPQYTTTFSSPQRSVSPVSSYDVRNSRQSPTSPQRTVQHMGSPTSPSSRLSSSGQGLPTRGILSQRRSMQPTPSSARTPRTHNETGRTSRLPSASNYVPSPQSSTGVVQNIPESIDRAGKIMEALYNRDLQCPSLFTALVGRENTGMHPVSGLVDQDYPSVVERGLLSEKLFTVQHQTSIPPELRELLARKTKFHFRRLNLT